MRRLVRRVLTIAVCLVFLGLSPGAARATPERCRAAIVKASAAFVQARAKALHACEQAKLGGKLAAATDCTTQAKTAARLAQGRARLVTAVGKACGGPDKLCGGLNGADDEALAAIGWDVGACPDFETGDCTNPIATCADIPTCLACVTEAAVDQSIDLAYGALTPTDPKTTDKAEKALRKCQAAIGKAVAAFVVTQSKALVRCSLAAAKAGGGACPDSAAGTAVAAAQAKLAARIGKACRGPDKTPGTADDPSPDAIGFVPRCFDVAPIGAASCDGPVDSLAALAACAGCVSRLGAECADRVAVPALGGAYPAECNPPGLVRRECRAQRTVHVVAGIGSLAWFTQVWPLPAVVSGFVPTYAFDDPANAELVPGTEASHPLYARLIDGRRVFEGVGGAGEPSVFVAGINQAHTTSPTATFEGGTEVVAAGAARQGDLATGLPVIAFGALPYGPVPGAPSATVVADVDAAIAALAAATTLAPGVAEALQPSAAQLASLGIGPATPSAVATLARNLLFAANAFRFGLVATVLMPGFNDDPHAAFLDPAAYALRADGLGRVLDGFYAELAAHLETRCSAAGTRLSLADNTVLVVSGDTYKNPFDRAGWADGTPGNSNLLYVRSNGFLKPGWFGAITPGTRTDFDAVTGELAGAPNVAAATAAARLGVLYAITRGDRAVVTAVSALPFDGVIAPTP